MKAAPRSKVWTFGRKLLGNLLPMLIAAPFLAFGLLRYEQDGFAGWALVGLLATPIVVWLAINFIGQTANSSMKAEMGRRLHADRGFVRLPKHFVGFARPSYRGLLDAHEDVGFLIIHPESLEFFGETHRLELQRKSIKRIRYRPNAHTWVGLGRWVSVEGAAGKTPVRMAVEPREKLTLLGNRAYGKRLKAELDDWIKKTGPQTEVQDPMIHSRSNP